MAENTQKPQTTELQPELGEGGIPINAKTSDYYKIKEMPTRFNHPNWFQGYDGHQQHPLYMTTSSEYGGRKPTVHTMPISFHAKSQQFSLQLGMCGMYRNHSLNTALDQSHV